MQTRTLIFGAVVAATALAATIFAFSSFNEDATATSGEASIVLHRGNLAEPSTLDPQQIDGTWESRIVRDMFEGLLTNAADGSIILGDAQSFDVTEDGLTYTFTLKEGLVWSDGTPLTAYDYEFALRRMVDPETAAPLAFFLYNIVGARDINGGQVDDLTQLGAHALDDRTLQLQLIRPDPYMDQLLVNQPFFPVPRHKVAEFGDDWPRAGNIVTNGPYILTEWVPNDFVHAVRNPLYRDNANVQVDEIYYYPTEDAASALRRFRAGEIDLNADFPEQQIDWLREHMPEETHIDPSTCVGYITLNTQVSPFDDARVRRALSMSINREMLTNRVLRLGEPPAYSTVTPFAEGYTAARPDWFALSHEERLDRARALLAEVGYSDSSPLRFTYRYREGIKNRRAAIAIVDMWQDIGAQVDLVNTEVAVHYDDLQSGNFQLGDAGWCPFVTKPDELLGLAHSDYAEFNYAQYYNEEYEALYNDALSFADISRRNALLTQAEAILVRDMPVIPTYYYVNKNLVGPQVRGWVDNPRNTHLSRWLSIDESLRPEQTSFTDRIMRLFN